MLAPGLALASLIGLSLGLLGSVDLDWAILAGFTTAAVVGACVGTALASRVPQAAHTRGFAVLLLAMGSFVLYKNRGAFRTVAASGSSSTSAPLTTAAVAR